jgi:hypothetical protein
LACTLVAVNVQATTITAGNVPTISVGVEGFGGPNWEYSPALDALQNLPERGKKLGVPTAVAHILGDRADVTIQELEFDPDPFVLNNILITNTTGSIQFYTVGIALPTTFAAPNIISGNVRADVIDGGGAPGAVLSTVGAFPIYDAQIDFTSVATLLNALTTVVAPAGSSASASASFGPSVSGIPVTFSMGIQLRFSVTPGDTAAILSRFDIVPEPTTLSLGLLSVLATVVAGRSRC